jgi:protein LTV1
LLLEAKKISSLDCRKKMGRGKRVKPFIDKKTAATFHLVRRSQRDISGWNEEANDDEDGIFNSSSSSNNEFVLMPSPFNPPKYSQMIVLDPKSSSSATTQHHSNNYTISHHEELSSSSYMNHVKERLSSNVPHALHDVQAEIYDKFTKPITGEGTFISAKGGQDTTGASGGSTLLMQELASVLPGQEVERTLEAITINPDCMDPEVAAALFGDWDVALNSDEADGLNTFEEILDDFVITASQEPPAAAAAEEEAFDYDMHIQQLMERAKNSYAMGSNKDHAWANNDAFFFQQCRKLEEEDDDDDHSSNHYGTEEEEEEEVDSWGDNNQVYIPPGVVPALLPEEERALRSKYEATLAEYDTSSDSDEDGEYALNHHGSRHTEAVTIDNFSSAMLKTYGSSTCEMDDQGSEEEICTLRTNITTEAQQQHALLEITDQQLDSILNSYLQDREDRKLAEGIVTSQSFKIKKKSTGGSGFFALPQVEEKEEGKEEYYNLAEELAPAPEEILIDGKSYFSEKKINPWDCESILSTYSNLDNNPLVIQRKAGSKTKKKNKGGEPLIQLSNKTGLPIVASSRNDDYNDNSAVGINKGEARKRGETAEEKQARKLAAKKEKHSARLQKKLMKQVFKEESRKLDIAGVSHDIVGQSVFRY